jgi:ribonuclease P protein component
MVIKRLQQWAQFQVVMNASKVCSTPHFVLHQWQPDVSKKPNLEFKGLIPQELVLGALIPKRWAKRSVTRHLIKRQIFNVSEQFAMRLPATSYVVRLRSSFDNRQFISASSQALKLAVRQELTQLFIKLSVS